MKNADVLRSYIDFSDTDLFGSETADTEAPDELDEYFVEDPNFSDFTNTNISFGIARARKGVGKSALLKHADFTAQRVGALTFFLTGGDLFALGLPDGKTPNALLGQWTELLAKAACERIAEEIDVPRTIPEMLILRRCNPVSGKVSWYRRLLSSITIKIPFLGASNLSGSGYLPLLEEYLKQSEQKVWLLIDDVDATFTSSDHEKLVVSQFFTAARHLSHRVPSLRIRSSVRKDVWTTLARFDESLDKCEQHCTDIWWSYKGTLRIISNRVRKFLEANVPSDNSQHFLTLKRASDAQIFNLISVQKIRWGRGQSDAFRVFHRLSGGRPRWALQLCKAAALEASSKQTATKSGVALFTSGIVYSVLPAYSRFRIGDVVKEHKHQCAEIENLIMAFDGHKAEFTTAELLSYVETRIMRHSEVVIEQVNAPESKDICSFLYRVDFLEAVDTTKNATHYRYEDYPHFFRSLAADHSFVRWEVNPSFRAALHI